VTPFVVQAYTPDMLDAVADLLAESYLTNPVHMAVFGGAGKQQYINNRTLFSKKLAKRYLEGEKIVVLENDQILGFAHWGYGACFYAPPDKLEKAMPGLIDTFGDDNAKRMAEWTRQWGKHDPLTEHTHLGPIGVLKTYQGMGIGSLMMENFCAYLDKHKKFAYMETDRLENIRFYKIFGFKVTGEVEVLNVPTWLMARDVKK
jgi:ribosomal protein S18 acetylase RimI-like enzyme